MKKLLIILAILATFTGMAAAQNTGAQQPDQAQQDRGQDTGQQAPAEPQQGSQGGNAPDNPDKDAGPKKGKKPSLPEQASGTAKKVVGTVFGGISDSFSTIGDALSSILGGNKGE